MVLYALRLYRVFDGWRIPNVSIWICGFFSHCRAYPFGDTVNGMGHGADLWGGIRAGFTGDWADAQKEARAWRQII